MTTMDPAAARQGLVTAALDLAFGADAAAARENALAAWTFFSNLPDVERPLDNRRLYAWLDQPPEIIKVFAGKLRAALTTYMLPAFEGRTMILAAIEYSFNGRWARRSNLDLFGDLRIDTVNDTVEVPLLAIETLQALQGLPDGLKTCEQCDRLFYNLRRNVRFCGDPCRYRNNYERKRGIDGDHCALS